MRHFEIKTPLVSCHEHNEDKRSRELLEKIEAGQKVALVSDAGTPAISDPGFWFVSLAVARGMDMRWNILEKGKNLLGQIRFDGFDPFMKQLSREEAELLNTLLDKIRM